jgi:hypothetical protein
MTNAAGGLHTLAVIIVTILHCAFSVSFLFRLSSSLHTKITTSE